MPPLALPGRRGPIGSRAMPSRHRLTNGHLSRVAGASVRSRRIRPEILRPFRQSTGVSGSVRVSEAHWLVEICFRGDPPVCQGSRMNDFFFRLCLVVNLCVLEFNFSVRFIGIQDYNFHFRT